MQQLALQIYNTEVIYYTVRRGDTFKSISELVYEDAQYAEYIKTVNGLDKLVPGTMIFIPELDMEYTK